MPRTCFFFIPGLSEKYRTGGLLVIRDVADIFEKELGYKTHFVATHEKHPDAISPEKAFSIAKKNSSLFIVTWGPLIKQHIKLIQKNVLNARILYYAQSFGWNCKLPPRIPIVCVSRFVMAQWSMRTQKNYIGYIPPSLKSCFSLKNLARDIDILVHTRKQNDYCLKKLIPALSAKGGPASGGQTTHYPPKADPPLAGKLKAINKWIPQEEFAALLNRTKLFLYLTKPHKAGLFRRLPGEGFGLPALEAIACGALVGSNLLGGVTDFLTPGENCIKLENSDLDFDLKQIENAVKSFGVNADRINSIVYNYSRSTVAEKWKEYVTITQA